MRRKPKFLIFDVDPADLPSVAAREKMIEEYAQRYIDEMCEHETLDDYCEQVAMDLLDKSIKTELKARITRIRRTKLRIV